MLVQIDFRNVHFAELFQLLFQKFFFFREIAVVGINLVADFQQSSLVRVYVLLSPCLDLIGLVLELIHLFIYTIKFTIYNQIIADLEIIWMVTSIIRGFCSHK